MPTLDLLDDRDTKVTGYSETDLEDMSRLVEDILADFNVSVTVVGFHPGPVITRFELQLAAGVKVSRISSLSKDLARALLVTSVRIVEIIPGKSVVGLEIPNREREMVTLISGIPEWNGIRNWTKKGAANCRQPLFIVLILIRESSTGGNRPGDRP